MADEEPRFNHCQWLYGEGHDRKFCRNPAERGQSWCSQHMEKVFVSASFRQKAVDKLYKKLKEHETKG